MNRAAHLPYGWTSAFILFAGSAQVLGQPAPQPAAVAAPVCVTFDLGDASAIFSPAEQAICAHDLAAVATEQCAKRFLHVYQFQSAAMPLPKSPHLRLFIKRDAGWSLCATLSHQFGPVADPGEWAVTIVKPGDFLPEKTALVNMLKDALIPALFAQHSETIKPALRVRAPVGQGGAINPRPLSQIKDAVAALNLDANRFRNLRDLGFRIEGTCGVNQAPMVLLSDFCNVGAQADSAGFKVVQAEQQHKAVDLQPHDVQCLNGFKVGRVYLRDEPEPVDADADVIPG